jgi:uncharacterized membrane protein
VCVGIILCVSPEYITPTHTKLFKYLTMLVNLIPSIICLLYSPKQKIVKFHAQKQKHLLVVNVTSQPILLVSVIEKQGQLK